MYAGDTTYSTQLLVEIVSNAVDEFRLGHGDKINVTISNKDKDTTVTVEDFGQGFIPNEIRDDGKSVLEAAFSVLNTSGKYREDGTYEGTSLGSFGIGSKITTFLSHKLEVTTYRDNKYESILFNEGVFTSRVTGNIIHPSGTIVKWSPSEQFFTHTTIEENKIKDLFNTITCLCPGLTINLNINGGETLIQYYSQNGINDLVDEAVKNKEIIANRFNLKYEEGKEKIDMVLTYTSNYSSILIPYVNTGLTEKGPHITQVKSIITREFNKFFKDKKWLKDKDENLTGDDIQEGMYIVFNMTAPNVAYDAQVKSTVTKLDMSNFSTAIATNLQYWLANNEKEIKIIFDKAAAARKAREAAKKARDAARKPVDKKKAKLLNLPSKLVDANSKDRTKCELFIAEGDSAAGGLIEARNPETMAVFPIRGKIINLYKNSDEKVFANQEVLNIIQALGLDFDKKSHTLIYDKDKLRYNKIFTACDADPDGMAIKNLLLTCFWSLCPELILNGHIWITIPPLFRITKGKDTFIYLKDAKELEEYKEAHKGEKFEVNRNKGLGEQDSSELGPSILDPETRNVAQIVVNNIEEANDLFDTLMGTHVPPRREWLLIHSEEADENIW